MIPLMGRIMTALADEVMRPLRWLKHYHPRHFASLVYGVVYGVMAAVWTLIIGLVVLIIWGLVLAVAPYIA